MHHTTTTCLYESAMALVPVSQQVVCTREHVVLIHILLQQKMLKQSNAAAVQYCTVSQTTAFGGGTHRRIVMQKSVRTS